MSPNQDPRQGARPFNYYDSQFADRINQIHKPDGRPDPPREQKSPSGCVNGPVVILFVILMKLLFSLNSCSDSRRTRPNGSLPELRNGGRQAPQWQWQNEPRDWQPNPRD
jgi:hypothetical protein